MSATANSWTLLPLIVYISGCGVGHEDRPFCNCSDDRYQTVIAPGDTAIVEMRLSAAGDARPLSEATLLIHVDPGGLPGNSVRVRDSDGAPLAPDPSVPAEPLRFEETLDAESIPFAVSYFVETITANDKGQDVVLLLEADFNYCRPQTEQADSVDATFEWCEDQCP